MVNSCLRTLDVSENEISDVSLGGAFRQVLLFNTTLQNIDLSWNQLEKKGVIIMCDALTKNASVVEVRLSHNRIRSLTEWAHCISENVAKRFTAENFTLRLIASEPLEYDCLDVSGPTDLHEILSAGKERVKAVGDQISRLQVANIIDACSDCLDMIVRQVTSFHTIQIAHLSLHQVQIGQPVYIGAMRNLHTVRISDCFGIENIKWNDCNRLWSLIIFRCAFPPDCLNACFDQNELRTLSLIACELKRIPPSLQYLKDSLEVLSLAHNFLSALPMFLKDFRKLSFINIRDNHNIPLHIQILADRSPSRLRGELIRYADGAAYTLPVRVVFLGNSFVGKSTLVSLITSKKKTVSTPVSQRTEGASVLPERPLGDARAIFIDAGGRRVYHVINEFLLDPVRTIFVILCGCPRQMSIEEAKFLENENAFEKSQFTHDIAPQMRYWLNVLTDAVSSDESLSSSLPTSSRIPVFPVLSHVDRSVDILRYEELLLLRKDLAHMMMASKYGSFFNFCGSNQLYKPSAFERGVPLSTMSLPYLINCTDRTEGEFNLFLQNLMEVANEMHLKPVLAPKVYRTLLFGKKGKRMVSESTLDAAGAKDDELPISFGDDIFSFAQNEHLGIVVHTPTTRHLIMDIPWLFGVVVPFLFSSSEAEALPGLMITRALRCGNPVVALSDFVPPGKEVDISSIVSLDRILKSIDEESLIVSFMIQHGMCIPLVSELKDATLLLVPHRLRKERPPDAWKLSLKHRSLPHLARRFRRPDDHLFSPGFENRLIIRLCESYAIYDAQQSKDGIHLSSGVNLWIWGEGVAFIAKEGDHFFRVMVIIHPIHMFVDVLARPVPQKHLHVSGNSLVRLMKRVCNTIEEMVASEPTNFPITMRALDAQSMYRIIQSGEEREIAEIMQSRATEYSMEAITSGDVALEEEARRELLYSHCIIPQGISIFMASVMETLSLLKCEADALVEENLARLEDFSQDYITRTSDPIKGTLLEIHQHVSRLMHDALHAQSQADFRSFWTRFNAYLCPLFLQAAQYICGVSHSSSSSSPSSSFGVSVPEESSSLEDKKPKKSSHDHERTDPRKETDILLEIVNSMAVRASGMLSVVWMRWFALYLSLLNDECVLSASKKRIVHGYQKNFGVEIMRPSIDEIAHLCENMSCRDGVTLHQEFRWRTFVMQKLSSHLVHQLHKEQNLGCKQPNADEKEGERLHNDLLELAVSNENALNEIKSKMRESFECAVDINFMQTNGKFSIECPLLMLEEGNPFVCMHTGQDTEILCSFCAKKSMLEDGVSPSRAMLLVGEEIDEMFPLELELISEHLNLEEKHIARLDLSIKMTNITRLANNGIKGNIKCLLDASDWVFSLSPSPEIQHCALVMEFSSTPCQLLVARFRGRFDNPTEWYPFEEIVERVSMASIEDSSEVHCGGRMYGISLFKTTP
eukprot:TRINITY_DN7505_c0_g1_i1.p1 TRINITY_DN7505_c0_g1~~TRINITY_DN7505_c0_g1_i1.p1  ORF type:complete len:1431 (+),score=368.19 TRINITY_DN7505_c0_g1_i1:435-4727(+)